MNLTYPTVLKIIVTIAAAISIPRNISRTAFLGGIPKTKAIVAPVHAPVTGRGIPTNVASAKPEYFSKHNTSYWQGKHYLGIGPSAHSFNGEQRSWNFSNNAKYIQALEKKVLPSQIEILTDEDRFNEYIMTGLRTIWGVSFNKVETQFGREFLQHLNT